MNNIATLNSIEIEQVNGGHDVIECIFVKENGKERSVCRDVEHEHPEPQLF